MTQPTLRIAIVRSSFYKDLLVEMEGEARKALKEAGVDEKNIRTVTVPGSFEIPLACKKVIEQGNIDGIVALGIIIQGETHHAAEIARGCTEGLMRVQLKTGVPIVHEVLFVDSRKQAEARVGKGAEAARTLIEMMKMLEEKR